MKNYSERIEEEKRAHLARIEALHREAELAATLPAGFDSPYMIHRAASDDPLAKVAP